tara:strand:+ start:4520 stop:5155 length:636 start_codon:yes stop_codon:yes gene_type:complete
MKRNKLPCSRCDRLISKSNYKKHLKSCEGRRKKKIREIDFDPNEGFKTGKRKQWNAGLSKETHESIRIQADRQSKTKTGKIGTPHTKEMKEYLSKVRCEALRENAFYSKRTIYRGVVLDSSYELIVAKSLDENGIKWIRPKPIKWNDDGQIRRYIPDFYLPKYNIYLDPKNDFLIKKDRRKISLAEKYNKVRILILSKDQLDWSIIKNLVP